MFPAGEKFDSGHYTVIEELGQGGMGIVYHCHDEVLERDVAIKMLLPELMTNQDTVATFRQEARLAGQLEHPNIVTIYDIGQEQRKGKTLNYIVMEYLPGGNLAGRITHSDLSLEHKLNWLKQMAGGLSFAHKRGVIHQDIKADNIFITEEGDLKIGDFGLARIAADRVKQRSVHGMGTPAYMSPELCAGEQQDNRSDIYSMGVLFYEVTTGELPYKARGMIEMAMKHSSAPIPSARKINPQIPDVLDKVIQKMMSKEPAKRYQSMADVLSILDDLIFDLRVARLGLGPKEKGASTGFFTGVEHKPSRGTTNLSQTAPSAQQPLLKEADVISQAAGGQLEANVTNVPTRDPAGAVDEINKPKEKYPQEAPSSATTRKSVSTAPREFQLMWSFHTNGPIGWKSMPVIGRDESLLMVGSGDGYLYAIETSQGRQIWDFETLGPIMSGPVLWSDKVITASTDGNVYSLFCKSGLTDWKFRGSAPIVATPTIQQDTVFASTMDGGLVAIDVRTGLLKWRYELASAIVSMVQAHGNLVFCATKSGDVCAISIHNGNLKWKSSVGGSFVSGPMVSADSIFVGNQSGVLYALDVEKGRLIWRYEAGKAIISKGAIVFASVIFCSQDKWMYCCDKYDGHLIWKAPIRGRVSANLSVSKGAVYVVTTDGWVQSFSQQSGELRWQLNCERRLEAPVLVTPDVLFIPTIEGDVLAYSAPTGSLPSLNP